MGIQATGRRQFQDIFEIVGVGSFSVDPAAFADDESQLITITVPGAALGDFVLVGPGIDMAEGAVTAYVSAASTVKVQISHVGGDTTNLAAANWRLAVLRLGANYANV